MKKDFLLLVIVLGLFVMTISCKKQSDSTPVSHTCMLMQAKGLNDTLYASFEYNVFGQITKESHYGEKNTLEYYDTYSYSNSNSTVVLTHYNGNGKVSHRPETYTLDSKGYASLSVSRDSNAEYTSTDSTTFSYDANGYLLKAIQSRVDYYPSGKKYRTLHTTTYSYSNGNVISITSTNGTASPDTIWSFTYTDKIDKIGFFLAPLNISSKLMGRSNTNLVLKASYLVDDGGGPSIWNNSYEFDSKGYVTKVTSVSAKSGATPTSIYYSYNCN